MTDMKCYKLTLARIGRQESWAGWRIAGRSENAPRQLMESFESFHGSKNHVVSSLNKPVELYEVAEHRGNLFVSNIRFGIKDMLGRPSFSVRGIAFPISENPNIFKHPDMFLQLSNVDFDFQLKKLYDESRNLKQEYITGNNVVTIHDDKFDFNRHLSLDEIISKHFSNEEMFECFVRSIFWAGNNNQTTLCLKVSNSFADYFEIMYLVYKMLPLSMRSNFNFRTYNLPNLSGAKIVFSEEVSIGKYFNILTGENNIFVDSNILTNSRKLTFIDYIFRNLGKESNEEYFELLQDALEKMGQSKTTDLNTIEIAHNMLMRSNEDDTDLSDMEVLKKFQEYVSLEYSNDIIDENIVKYLEIIIQKGIYLNDTLMKKLDFKLKSTKYIPLVELGYEYKVSKLLENENKQNSFESLFSIEKDAELYDKYVSHILEFVTGARFLDDYYANFYIRKCVSNIEELCDFYSKTKNLPDRTLIYKRINAVATEWSMDNVELMLEKHIDFDYQKHIYLLNEKLGLASTSKSITEKMKKKYWSEFRFDKFEFSRINDYLTYLPYENWQYNLIRGINDIIQELDNQRPDTVRRFNSYVRGLTIRGINLSPDEQSYLKKEFQQYCLKYSNKNHSLDFWLEISRLLSSHKYIEFIFENDIKVFTVPELFEREFLISCLYNDRSDKSNEQKYISFCYSFLNYIDNHGQYDELGRILTRIQSKDKSDSTRSLRQNEKKHLEIDDYIVGEKSETGIKGFLHKHKDGIKNIIPGSKKGKHGKHMK